jgi:hypothetical protein
MLLSPIRVVFPHQAIGMPLRFRQPPQVGHGMGGG